MLLSINLPHHQGNLSFVKRFDFLIYASSVGKKISNDSKQLFFLWFNFTISNGYEMDHPAGPRRAVQLWVALHSKLDMVLGSPTWFCITELLQY